ncbi:MAG: SPOR domain-containing protein [Polaromonas sp.]|nr:SPOR domain-containing protein [Polaromonas sp.]
MKKQMGGTLLGIVIGALLGLGAALAVAVYVTKVPVPFMNKSQARNPDQDANEAKKNQNWDPNAPLAGRNAAPRPAPAASGLLTAPASGLPLPAASAPVAAATPRAPVSADPLGDLARQRSDAAGGVDPFSYFIQVGAFRTPEDAEQQRARLSLMGFQAKVTEREQSGRTVYRVRLGPYDKKDEADKAKERLDANSVETALVRVQR